MPEPTTCICGHDRDTHDEHGECWHMDAAGAEDCCCDRFDLAVWKPDAPATADLLALCEQLDGLRATATPGPWHVMHSADDRRAYAITTERVITDSAGCSVADAALIVAAVNALPALTAAVRELQADRDTLARVAVYVDHPGLPDSTCRKLVRRALGGAL